MKKEYMTPDLYFESFVLSESIAAGCSETGKAAIEAQLFNGNTGIICEKDGSNLEEYCYWTGSSNILFLS